MILVVLISLIAPEWIVSDFLDEPYMFLLAKILPPISVDENEYSMSTL